MRPIIHVPAREHTPAHHSFPLFAGQLGAAYRLDYIGHHNQFFPVGFIGDKRDGATTPDEARQIAETVFGSRYDPIIQLALGHESHNIVQILNEVPRKHTTVVGDAVIVRKPADGIRTKPIAIGTFLGDCPVVCVASNEWLGYIHCGRPEAMAEPNIIEAFLDAWPAPAEETHFDIGPGICGRHYGLKTLDEKYRRWSQHCDFPGEIGFYLSLMIVSQLHGWYQVNRATDRFIRWENHCPYCERENGHAEWASDQWFKRNRPGEHSPRDWAVYTYTPGSKI